MRVTAPAKEVKGDSTMPTYIMLHRFRPKGIENIKESADRLDAVKKAFNAMGAELKDFYLVSGQYDAITVIEAPNDETIARCALALGSKGTVTTETLRAFTEDEFRKIIAGLP